MIEYLSINARFAHFEIAFQELEVQSLKREEFPRLRLAHCDQMVI